MKWIGSHFSFPSLGGWNWFLKWGGGGRWSLGKESENSFLRLSLPNSSLERKFSGEAWPGQPAASRQPTLSFAIVPVTAPSLFLTSKHLSSFLFLNTLQGEKLGENWDKTQRKQFQYTVMKMMHFRFVYLVYFLLQASPPATPLLLSFSQLLSLSD